MKTKEEKQKIKWRKLENASKIFPAVSNNKDTKVYRISAELYRDINAENLQKALDLTLGNFPIYQFILRRGFFWYYFESSNIEAKIEKESTNPCSPLYIKGEKNLLFRVSYYKKRINLETFHTLADGAGAIWFMETLVFYYMKATYKEELTGQPPSLEHGASISQKMDDSFWKNYTSIITDRKIKKEKYKRAYKIKGKRIDENKMKIIEGAMSVEEVLNVSRQYDSSMTVFLAGLLMYSIYLDMPRNKRRKPVVLSVPIDMRGYYQSFTARNFFTTMDISYDFQNNSLEFEDIIEYVDQEFKKGLKEENIHLKLARFMKFEKNPVARIIPLTIKDFVMKIIDLFNDAGITSSISNVGRVKTAKEFEDHIKQFSICVSARTPKITFCSYRDRLVITFTSPYLETDIEREFFQFLSKKGIEIEITSNM